MTNKAIIEEDALNLSNIMNEMWNGTHFGYQLPPDLRKYKSVADGVWKRDIVM